MEYLFGSALGAQFNQNQLLTGGLLLFIIGGIITYIKTGLSFIGEFIMRRLVIQVELTQNEDTYRWLMLWLADHPKNLLVSQQHRVIVQQKSNKIKNYWQKQNQDDIMASEPPELLFVPGEGLHFIYYSGRIIILKRSKDTAPADTWGMNAGQQQQQPRETVVLYTFGRTKYIIEKLVHESMLNCLNKDKEKTIIFIMDNYHGGHWSRALAKPKRSFDSVILDSNVAEDIRKDAEDFLKSADWYRELGVPYRRSYLLYGKPGCGKTSFVTALAGKLNLNVCVLTLSNQNMNDSMINTALREAPEHSLILIEDIDAAFPSREESSIGNLHNPRAIYRAITFSGVLNAIDGIASQEGRIIVMTTNTIEKLDPALIRPGRVDRMIQFSLATKSQARKLFERFYPKEKDLAAKFSEKIEEDTVSMAALQGLFMRFKTDGLGAYNYLPEMLADLKKKEQEEKERQEKKESQTQLEKEEEIKQLRKLKQLMNSK